MDGGGTQAREGAGGAEEAADGSWQRPEYTMAIGEMEDDGVGQETAAKAAAFFDVSLESPRVSTRGSASPGPAAVGRRSGGGDGGGGGRPVSSTRDPGSGSGVDGVESREPTAAEMWMYGSVDDGSGAERME